MANGGLYVRNNSFYSPKNFVDELIGLLSWRRRKLYAKQRVFRIKKK